MKKTHIPSGLLAGAALFVLSAYSANAQSVTTPNALSGYYDQGTLAHTTGATASSTSYTGGYVLNLLQGNPTPILGPFRDGSGADYVNISGINNTLGLDTLQVYAAQNGYSSPTGVTIYYNDPSLFNPTAASSSLDPGDFANSLTFVLPTVPGGFDIPQYATLTTGPEYNNAATPDGSGLPERIAYDTLTTANSGFAIPAGVTSLLFHFTGAIQIDQIEAFGPGTPMPAAVPEPSTWAMMLGGLAALFAISRRRLKA